MESLHPALLAANMATARAGADPIVPDRNRLEQALTDPTTREALLLELDALREYYTTRMHYYTKDGAPFVGPLQGSVPVVRYNDTDSE